MDFVGVCALFLGAFFILVDLGRYRRTRIELSFRFGFVAVDDAK